MKVKPKFELGNFVETRGIAIARKENPQFDKDVRKSFERYCKADWLDMEYEEDRMLNEEAIKNGDSRIFATYNTCKGKIYIITEWDRSCTTVLFPHEY